MQIALGQRTDIFNTDSKPYREALELFDKEKYAAAQKLFEEYMKSLPDRHLEQYINAEFHAGVCALYLFHKDAEYRLEKFVQMHPESPWVKKVYYELANYNYRRKKYKKALEWFQYIDENQLNEEELVELRFKRGHTNFLRDNFEEARPDLFFVKDQESEYKSPALYFYSHIAYESDQLQNAFDGFKQLENDPNFSPLVPYYLTQILYKQGKYDDLLDYAPAFVDSTGTSDIKRQPEIAQLVGDAYYRENDYQQALPFLEQYHEETRKADKTREDFFQMGYTYYVLQDYEKALEYLNEAGNEDDALAQSAVYHMADAYLKLDQKQYARTAFEQVSSMDHIRELKENALFNYAKLSYELSYNPFHEAITAFEDYIEEYPNSVSSDEAYEFLLQVYMKSKNYEKALASLDKITNKDTRTKEAYQIVAFNRGVELMRAEDRDRALAFFDKATEYTINNQITAETKFWKAEIAYSKAQYTKAIGLYNAFLQQPGGYGLDIYPLANYGIGYSQFKQENYGAATTAFRKFVDSPQEKEDDKVSDAYLRVGDGYYIVKDYSNAINYYNLAIGMNQANKDHGMYYKALCYELNDQPNKAIGLFNKLIEEQPNSKYTIDAEFEIAKTYLSMNDYNNAQTYYEGLINDHPTSRHTKFALRDLTLIQVKKGNDSKVIELWNRIKAEYPTDQIALDTYNLVESTLISNGQLNDLPPVVNVSDDDIELKIFRAAEDFAITGDCANGISKLEEYLTKYSPALKATEAHYYLANCYFEAGNMSKALESFNYVVAQPISDYTEESLVAAATINYNNEDYEQALNHYIELESINPALKKNLLEAQIGQLRCYYYLGRSSNALEYADKVIENPNTPSDIARNAYLWRGKIRMDNNELDPAYYDFLEVDKIGGKEGAEAKYYMCEIAFRKDAYDAAETEIFGLIENYSSYSEWKF
ncbi:MAG: tetratricopeptide repeat protein, partial [Flavobacteriales bacterium]|nr:tetratricopeptide repeat protein [Flavobacteriales bacterium]